MRNVLRSLLADLGMFLTALAMTCWRSRRRPLPSMVLLDSAERQARANLGIGPAYPEYVSRELPEKQEEWLAELAENLWPEDEFTDIVREFPGGSS